MKINELEDRPILKIVFMKDRKKDIIQSWQSRFQCTNKQKKQVTEQSKKLNPDLSQILKPDYRPFSSILPY